MAKFCTKCGKKLVDGKCDCQKEVKNIKKVEEDSTEAVKEKVTEASEKVNEVISKVGNNDYFKKVVEITKSILVKPTNIMKKYSSKKNINLGYILFAVVVFVQALFVTIGLSNTLSEVNDGDDARMNFALATSAFMNEDRDGYVGILDSILEIDEDEGEIKLNVITVMLYSVVISAAIYAIILGALYIVINNLMKKKLDIKKLLVTTSIASSALILTFLAMIVLVFIYPALILPVLILGILYFIISLYQGLTELEDLDINKFPLMYTLSYALVAVVIYIVIKVIM